ncbi:PDZ domain-containing protein [Azospirillum humicireducens]|uniref:PDZ domain-containing protein n=1 Tax=Azospirillum humicireducens TaxID=1226968 RepID=A0A161JHA4_9PROT|nr:ChaN family lipoprotein [Azospirillum humicireducens]ANC92147.1 PDZ domain-containing protein [Azospirillum humicireducens]
MSRQFFPAFPRLVPLVFAALAVTAAPDIRAEEAARVGCVPPGVWADGTGTALEPVPLLRRLADAPVVLLGEQHDKADHHRWQLHTLAGLHALNPDLAIGLEMLPRRLQPVLDRWVAGELTESEFLKETDWRTVWGFDPGFYLPILQFARLYRLPVVALNVERSLISRTARNGWAAIPQAEREGVGTPAAPTETYSRRLTEMLATHERSESQAAAPTDAAKRFIEAQGVWDRAMAEKIAETRRTTGRAVVGILGQGHALYRDGVPHQLADLGIPDSAVLLPWDADRDCGELDGRIADAVFGLGPAREDAEPQRPRLGVQLDPGPDGITVGAVSDGSVAAAAGLRSGDRILNAAGSPVRAPADLVAVIRRQAPGTWLPLTIRRDGAEQELVAKFPTERR